MAWENLLTTQIINFPNIKGRFLALHFKLGKILQDSSTNSFGILPENLYPVMCLMKFDEPLKKFLTFCETHNLALQSNFHKFTTDKTSNGNNPSRFPKMSTEDMTNRLKFHMAKAGMEPSTGGSTFSMHSFTSGGPASMLLERVPLQQIMTRAFWKHAAMSMHNI